LLSHSFSLGIYVFLVKLVKSIFKSHLPSVEELYAVPMIDVPSLRITLCSANSHVCASTCILSNLHTEEAQISKYIQKHTLQVQATSEAVSKSILFASGRHYKLTARLHCITSQRQQSVLAIIPTSAYSADRYYTRILEIKCI
jgi:hypothetical protein